MTYQYLPAVLKTQLKPPISYPVPVDPAQVKDLFEALDEYASTIRLTTELDCKAAVESAPTSTLLSGRAVCSRMNFLKGLPASSLSDCSSWCMPNRKSPKPDASRQMSMSAFN